jgi:hypothetical protein
MASAPDPEAVAVDGDALTDYLVVAAAITAVGLALRALASRRTRI